MTGSVIGQQITELSARQLFFIVLQAMFIILLEIYNKQLLDLVYSFLHLLEMYNKTIIG